MNSNNLKIVQLQFSKESAGSSAIRLHKAFLQEGINSTLLSLKHDTVTDEHINYLSYFALRKAKLEYKLKSICNKKYEIKYGHFSYPFLGTDVSNHKMVKAADIIYLHWVLGGFLNFKNLENIFKLNKPVIIIMHDMWYLTGGCHYSFHCSKYEIGCNHCQILNSNKKNDLSFRGFYKKQNLFNKYNNLNFVSPSKWLFECSKKSILIKEKPIYYIPNALDSNLYKPINKKSARDILNIDQKDTVIAFGASNINSPYKGWKYLQKALALLQKDENFKNITILIFGSGNDITISSSIPFKCKFLGYLEDDYSVMLAYNSADVFVAPSLADNQPTTVMESLSSGTSVVAFNIGGLSDMIKHKENGYLAKYLDCEDLANGIKFCIQYKIIGKILSGFEIKQVISKHIELINVIKNKLN